MRPRIAVAVFMITLGTTTLIYTASQAEGVVYKTASEIRTEASTTRSYRLTGHALRGSIARLTAERRVVFVVLDANGDTMRATYQGIIPDTFKDSAEVVISGRYDRLRDELIGSELLAKCPSKYQGKYDTSAYIR